MCLFPSDTHVHNALIYSNKLPFEARSNLLHLYLLQVKWALPKVLGACAELTAIGLLQVGATPCGEHS